MAWSDEAARRLNCSLRDPKRLSRQPYQEKAVELCTSPLKLGAVDCSTVGGLSRVDGRGGFSIKIALKTCKA